MADQFKKLSEFINDVFDSVRAAVKGFIDDVKAAALVLIDLAATAIKTAIENYGNILKSAVNTLLADRFPVVARVLNAAIDVGVARAIAAVDVVADRLKAGITALLDLLAAGIDAILNAYQAAINAVMAVVQAALSGDWSELARMILEPILRALGIEPEAFYLMISRAMEAIGIIIDDPIGFLSNLVAAVVGGIRQFASNLFRHLQVGIIVWLTGSLGGNIRVPEQWNLVGVLELVRQILGLTVGMVRRVAVRVIGEQATARIEFFMGYAVELISGGWSALWEKITADLAQLKDTVLEQIKKFLLERVVMAAVTWLASLFSPVGALVKLVMTIWNFMMFLKRQLQKIIAVVQKIVTTMYEIATGVLQPAKDGVEQVIAGMLPIALTLLASLLGLGDVSGRVQDIIKSVRLRIENALVRLVQRVLARFRGPSGAAADDDTDLMTPVAFAGGGESHTLYIQENGTDAVPMMRSTPTPVETWLRGLRGAGLDAIGASKTPAWSVDQINDKRTEIEPLLTAAIGEEAKVDSEGDAAEAVESSAQPGETVAPSATLQLEGEKLAETLSQILAKLGLSDPPLEVKFSDQIAAMHPDVRDSFIQRILPKMIEKEDEYISLSWSEISERLSNAAFLPNEWKSPARSGGILRSSDDSGMLEFESAVKDVVEVTTETTLPSEITDPLSLKHFFDHYLTRLLNNEAQSITFIRLMIAPPSGNLISALVEESKSHIESAAKKFRDRGKRPQADKAFRDGINGKRIDEILLAGTSLKPTNPAFAVYYPNDDIDLTGEGHAGDSNNAGIQKSLIYFLRESPNATANRALLGDRIRAVSRGNHEWIPVGMAADIIEGTAALVRQPNSVVDAAQGLGMLLRFQEKVRTPTSQLMLKPSNETTRTVGFVSQHHYNNPSEYTGLSIDQIKQRYLQLNEPVEYNQQVPVISAHTGGLSSFVADPSNANGYRSFGLSKGSGKWHDKLEADIAQPMVDGVVTAEEGRNLGAIILNHFRTTIWRARTPISAVNSRHFDVYFRNGQQATYAALESIAPDEFRSVREGLSANIRKAIAGP